jgi:hypothetical protein
MRKAILIVIISCSVFFLSQCSSNKALSKKKQDNSSLISDERSAYILSVNNGIKGKENVAADSVYINLQYIGGFEASVLPEIMEKWSKALGVSCTHCHNTAKWESDEKPEKHIARKMAEFSFTVSKELRKIDGLKSVKPTVNCMTCHNGNIKPVLK